MKHVEDDFHIAAIIFMQANVLISCFPIPRFLLLKFPIVIKIIAFLISIYDKHFDIMLLVTRSLYFKLSRVPILKQDNYRLT